jgi:carnitine 3-dehydrogenase
MASWWETLGNPTLTRELQERLAEGIAAETAGHGITKLAAWRDRFLVDLLALKAGRN